MARHPAFAIIKINPNIPGWTKNPEWIVEVAKIVFDPQVAEDEARRLNSCAEGTEAKFVVKSTKVVI